MKTRIIGCEGFQFEIRQGKRDQDIVGEIGEGHFSKRCVFKHDDVWLDAGGGIGTFCIPYSGRVRRIVSYEPEPGNYRLLQRNLLHNGVRNVEALHFALVGNQDTERDFYVNRQRNMGAHSFYEWRKDFRKERVACVNINDALNRHKPTCLKMDVNGAEHELIHAIEDWSHIEEMFLEYCQYILSQRGVNRADDVAFLRERFEHVKVDGDFGPRRGWSLITCRRDGRVSC